MHLQLTTNCIKYIYIKINIAQSIPFYLPLFKRHNIKYCHVLLWETMHSIFNKQTIPPHSHVLWIKMTQQRSSKCLCYTTPTRLFKKHFTNNFHIWVIHKRTSLFMNYLFVSQWYDTLNYLFNFLCK